MIIFGSESNNIEDLEKLANFRCNEPQEFIEKLHKHLANGINYQRAYMLAMSDITSDKTLQKLISSPNDILGSSYIKEIKNQKSQIEYYCIQRTDNGYNSQNPKANFLSASSIIELKNKHENYSDYIPSFTKDTWLGSPVFDNDIYTSLLRYKFATTPIDKLSNIFGMNEGIENKLQNAINKNSKFSDIVDAVATKRYRTQRINKLLLYSILEFKKEDYKKIKQSKPTAKVLAIKNDKKHLLSLFSKANGISLILSNSDYNKLSTDQQISMSLDLKASDIYSICTNTALNPDKTIGTLYL